MAKYFAGGHLRFQDGEWRDDSGNIVDVVEVRHGRWKRVSWGAFDCCSVCGCSVQALQFKYYYCPNCGAKMDGGFSK